MKVLHFGLALLLVTASVSGTSFAADDQKSTRNRIKRKPAKSAISSKAHNNTGLKTIEKHAMEVENAHEGQEAKHFEHMLHVFESYIQKLSGDHFAEHDFKALHEAFHALTPAQKETFLKQFAEGKVEAHIIEKLKLVYQQFPHRG